MEKKSNNCLETLQLNIYTDNQMCLVYKNTNILTSKYLTLVTALFIYIYISKYFRVQIHQRSYDFTETKQVGHQFLLHLSSD